MNKVYKIFTYNYMLTLQNNDQQKAYSLRSLNIDSLMLSVEFLFSIYWDESISSNVTNMSCSWKHTLCTLPDGR